MFVLVIALFFVPGLALAAALGLRGWRLAAVAPAITFGLVATGGPVLYALDVRWSLPSFAGWVVAVTALLVVGRFGVGRFLAARRASTAVPDESVDEVGPARYTRWEHVTVGVGVIGGMGVGALAYLRGTQNLTMTNQRFDAPFHANAVRWIAEHGNAVPTALAPIADIPADQPWFYPVTYHSLLALVVQTAGADVVAVLNTAALTLVLLWPLGIAAFGLAWRVPVPAVAVAALVSTWFTAFPFDSLWRGPLWPYVAGVALLPGALATGRLLIERFPVMPAVTAVALALTGLVTLHPSLAFVLLVYVLALGAAFVLRLEPIRWRRAVLPLVAAGALTAVVLLPLVLPARAMSAGVRAYQWPELASQVEGFGQVMLFSPLNPTPQWWLGLAALVGVVLMIIRRRLLWVVAAWLVFGAVYAATASMNTPLVNAISGPFYNDAWRLAALLPLAGAFAVAETVYAAGTWVTRSPVVQRVRLAGSPAGLLVVMGVGVTVLGVLCNGAYAGLNAERIAGTHGDGPAVSAAEKEAYTWLAARLQGDEQVINDRQDGSVWMYAVTGVQPMESTFVGSGPDTVAGQLYGRFNQLDDDPEVRRLVDEANVRYAIVGEGFVNDWLTRAPGLQDLDDVRSLREVFRNDDAVVYEVVRDGADQQ
jgi:hypothetical protein